MRSRAIRSGWILVLMVAAVTVGCSGKEQRKAEHLQRGKQYLAEQNFPKAKVELKNVLQIDPYDAEAYFYIGQIDEQADNLQAAFAAYSKVEQLEPTNVRALVKLAQFYALGGEQEEANHRLEKALQLAPLDEEVRVTHAAFLARAGRDSEALAAARMLWDAAPRTVNAGILYSALLHRSALGSEAEKVLIETVEANPGSIKARLALARHYFQVNEPRKSEALLRDVVALEPGETDHRARLAGFYLKGENVDGAEATLREALAVDQDPTSATLLLVDLLRKYRSMEAAEEELKTRIAASPMLYELRFALAALYTDAHREDDAKQVLLDAIAQDPSRPECLDAKLKLAVLAMKRNRLEEVRGYLSEVLAESSNNTDGLALRGSLALNEGDLAGAIGDFRSVLRERPSDAHAMYALASAYAAKRQPELAVDTFRRLVQISPRDIDARLALAQLLIDLNDKAGAAAQLEVALVEDPENFRALEMQFELAASELRWEEASVFAARMQTVMPDASVGYYKLGQAYSARKRYEEAAAEFTKALARAGVDTADPLRALAMTYVIQDRADEARRLVNEQIRKNPDAAHNYNLLGEVLLAQGDVSAAEQAFMNASKRDPSMEVSYVNVGRVRLMENDPEGAIAAYEKGMKHTSNSVQLFLLAAAVHEQANRIPDAIEVYERALTHNPGSDLVANNLAALLAENDSDPASVKRALELAQRFADSDNAVFLDTLGWAYFKAGDTTQAVRILEKAEATDPGVPIVRFHLGMARYKAGDHKLARDYLNMALDAKENFPGIEQAKAIVVQAEP